MRWLKIYLPVFFVVLINLSYYDLYGMAADSTSCAIARYYAERLLRTESVHIQYHTTLTHADGSPYTYLFCCQAETGTETEKILTLGIAADRNHFPLLFYYFGLPIDEMRQERHGRSDASPGTVPFTQSHPLSEESRQRRSRAWDQLDSALAGGKTYLDTAEVIVSGVPNYLWYLNCGIISETMILGYWDDHGYDFFIPGGDSRDGYYWAVAEELYQTGFYTFRQFAEENRIVYYTKASEYGNHAEFFQLDKFREWEAYQAFFTTYNAPLEISWQFPESFIGHAMVGIGYRIEGDQRFIIHYDTWYQQIMYRNFDEIMGDYRSCFIGVVPKSMDLESHQSLPSFPMNVSSEDTVSLHSLSLYFWPDLIPMEKSYHCMASADIDGDGMNDLIVGNFRNSYPPWQQIELYLQNAGWFIKNNQWVPQYTSHETVHIIEPMDFDGDGDVDIAAAGILSKVRLFVNQNGILDNTPVLVDTGRIGTDWFMDLAWSDYDLDGDQDLISSTLEDIRIYPNQNGTFNEIIHIDSTTEYSQVKLADINADDYPDLIACTRIRSVVVFKNESGQFAEPPIFAPSTGHGALCFDVADVDQDGFLEIVTVDDGQIVWFDNQDGILSETPHPLNNTTACYAKDIVLNDLDEDGFPELIAANYNTQNCIFKNVNGTFQSTPCWTSEEVIPTVRVHVHDLWDDGKKQILFLKPRGAQPEFFQTGSGLPGSTTKNVSLEKGWNLVSFPLNLAGQSVEEIMEPIQDHLALLKNDSGQTYIPGVVNTIDHIDYREGYQAYIDQNVSFEITGQPVNPTSILSLSPGDNLISYFPEFPMDTDTAFSSIDAYYIQIVKNNEGNTYIPKLGIDDIGQMLPGQAYYLRLSAPRDLTYPIVTASSGQPAEKILPVHFDFTDNTGENAIIVLFADQWLLYSDNSPLQNGDEIGVFTTEGLCCGAVVWEDVNTSLTVWGDDSQSDSLDGFLNGQCFCFRVWSKKTDTIYEAEASFTYASESQYSPNGLSYLYSLRIDLSTGTLSEDNASLPSEFRVSRNYPNPFNPVTKIIYDLPKSGLVILTVFNIQGERITTLVNKLQEPGRHTAIFDGSPFPSGVYFYRFQYSGLNKVGKILLTK